MQADDATLPARAILPEVFSLTAMEESFRMVVLMCHNALANLEGRPASAVQLGALALALARLARRPFLRSEDALGIGDDLEETELQLDAKGVERLMHLVIDHDDEATGAEQNT